MQTDHTRAAPHDRLHMFVSSSVHNGDTAAQVYFSMTHISRVDLARQTIDYGQDPSDTGEHHSNAHVPVQGT